ncbi:alanine racemase [Paralcaligenes sp. KSB-10]|uniref:alanine racemase n=1 Tax=Paralcaligenes sp. KSB-10 TaxID=2901142 RepID=UPI001E50EDFB|nr:alanine racemase [Paralcaligenes sp. KSB-10]UHL65865.1 alanine racemase [Paralcaligenes sp. KSB-10]
MPRPIAARISLSALSHNLHVVANQLCPADAAPACPRPLVWAVIKANAYGHGLLNAVGAFAQADGLAMLDLNEAVRCREAGWAKPILLLEGFFEAADIPVLDRHQISITVHNQEQLDMLRSATPRRPIDAMIKLNTGMNRLGFSGAQYRDAYQQATGLQQKGVLGALGKMTHFARADDDALATREQIQYFNETTKGLPGKISLCNSAATLTPGLWSSSFEPVEQWVRPGICLYGASPFDNKAAHDFGLRPAMTLSAALISVRAVSAGSGVGYGHVFTAPHAMSVGVVACGYADGYPRHAPTGTPICVGGVTTRLIGRVSMDMLAVDLTHVPQAQVGTEVVLWGEGGPSVDDVAQSAGTIGYELLCALAPRVPVTVF